MFVFFLAVVDAHGREQLAASDRIIHHGLVRGLFLALNGQQRVLADLGRCVARAVGILQRNEAVLPCGLLELLVVVSLDQIVDPPLAQQVRFCLFCRASLAIGRALVHPVDAIDPFGASRSLQLPLDLLLCALLLDFIDALLGAFALGEGLLLFVVDGLLVPPQTGMERLFQVEIATTHDCGSSGSPL
jgi:hypothetical protein